MAFDRRTFLMGAGAAVAADALGAARVAKAARPGETRDVAPLATWQAVRAEFALAPDYTHLAGLLLASHPRDVRDAIARHRAGLDANPVHYLYDNRGEFEEAVLAAASDYLGADPDHVALTDSTTMGLGTLYTGIRLEPGQEAVCTVHCHYSTRHALALRAERTGASVREVALYEDLARVTTKEIVDAAMAAITPKTRVFAVTWVHSSTGLKLPIRKIADAIAEVNAKRDERDRVLFCVDGVHGFGIEEVAVADLGCDFFVAGCHKWIHGPRGTGIIWGSETAWPATVATIPSFSGHAAPGAEMTPGGFHSFEHRWALAEAFRFHARIGRPRIAARIHELARRAKAGLAAIERVVVRTPMSDELSAGLVCFDVEGASPYTIAERLRERKIIASVAPYASRHLRFATSIYNTPEEIDRGVGAVREIVAAIPLEKETEPDEGGA